MFVHLNRVRTPRFEFILLDAIQDIPGTLRLSFECRFRSSGTTKARIVSCTVNLSFSTPDCLSTLVIATRPTIEAPPDQGIRVTHTKSRSIVGQAGISYFASLRAGLTCTSTKKYSVTVKQTRQSGIRGSHGIDLWFHENRELKRGLNGDMGISVQIDEVQAAPSIRCVFSAKLEYTVTHIFGFTTSHLESIDTVFTLIL